MHKYLKLTDQEQLINSWIGKEVKKLRLKTGLSVDEFCYMNNLGKAFYYKFEAGRYFYLYTLIKILNIHKISIYEFFGIPEKFKGKRELEVIKDISKKVKRFRKESVASFAKRNNFAQSSVFRWEQGVSPHFNAILKMCTAHHVTIDEMLDL